MTTYALRVQCPSTRGIVAAVASYLAEAGCNITDSAQFDDLETGNFFMRISFRSEEGRNLPDLRPGFTAIQARFAMAADFFDEAANSVS